MKVQAKEENTSGPKNMFHKLFLMGQNKRKITDEEMDTVTMQHIRSFFQKIETGWKYEADTLAHELSDILVGSIPFTILHTRIK